MVIGSLKHLVSGRELTAEEETQALMLGWCVEWVRAMVATLSVTLYLPCVHVQEVKRLVMSVCWHKRNRSRSFY